MSDLRSRVIRLAYKNAPLRAALLPLLKATGQVEQGKMASRSPADRAWPEFTILHAFAGAAPAAPRVAYGPHDYDQVEYTKEAVYLNLDDFFGDAADVHKHDDGVSLGFKDYMGKGLDVGFEIVIRPELGYTKLDDDTKRKFPEFQEAVRAVDDDSFMEKPTAKKLAEVMGRIRRRIRR